MTLLRGLGVEKRHGREQKTRRFARSLWGDSVTVLREVGGTYQSSKRQKDEGFVTKGTKGESFFGGGGGGVALYRRDGRGSGMGVR